MVVVSAVLSLSASALVLQGQLSTLLLSCHSLWTSSPSQLEPRLASVCRAQSCSNSAAVWERITHPWTISREMDGTATCGQEF